MFKTITLILFTAIIGLLSFVAYNSMKDAVFHISNRTGETISLSAQWKNTARKIGPLGPNSMRKIKINDEAAIVFIGTKQNGSEIKSSEIYFTSGVNINIYIENLAIRVEYQ